MPGKYRIEQIVIFFLIIMTQCFSVSAQDNGRHTVTGRIINSEDGLPIANANISLAYTMTGTTSDRNGNFEIKNMMPGNYNIIVSHVGFKTQSHELKLLGNLNDISFKLAPRLYQLPDIRVKEDFPTEWFYDFRTFKTQLLGRSSVAQKCEIINPYIINFTRDSADCLLASADEPIIIINNALGYKITYRLDNFEYAPKYVKFSGMPIFSELAPESDEQKEEWKSAREKAYRGSLRHFLTLICNQSVNIDTLLEKEGFVVRHTIRSGRRDFSPFNILKNISNYIMPGSDSYEMTLRFENYWEIVYKNETEDGELVPRQIQPDVEVSWISLDADSVAVDIYGRYFEKFLIKTSGYMSQERLAEMVPYEYEIH